MSLYDKKVGGRILKNSLSVDEYLFPLEKVRESIKELKDKITNLNIFNVDEEKDIFDEIEKVFGKELTK